MPIPKSFFSLTLPANNKMNTTSTQQLGFTLVEMMIAIAILAKNPKWKTDEIKTQLDDFIASYKGHKDLADKYQYSAEMINASKSRAYRLKAIPTKTGYTLSVWMDSLGNAYKCTDIDSAKDSKTTMTNGKGCESVSKKKSS